jgi:alpha-L-fucosidase
VRPLETVNDEVKSWGANIPAWSQDIDMKKIATMARQAQPGLLIVDRTVHGEFENYQTPEQSIPATKLDYPWESCMTLGGAWGWVPNEKYKSTATVIHKLVEIVAKGGSLLLGVGPKADGTLPDEIVTRLDDIGKWLKQNGDAIYNTRTVEHYNEKNIFFTKSKNSNTHYAIVCIKESETIPSTIEWAINLPEKNSKIICFQTGKTVKWKTENNKVVVFIPENIRDKKNISALAFSFNPPEH